MPILSIRRCAAMCAAALILIEPACARQISESAPDMTLDPAVGEYSCTQMELVAGLRLKPDGTFDYGLTVGSLDEQAQGRWKRIGQRIELASDPRPIAPTITATRIEVAPGEPFAIRLLGPNGRDVAGVDLQIDFDAGEPLTSYLSGGPWSLPEGERRPPRFITFNMNAYRIHSGPLSLHAEAGTVATFLLTPNDFGVADLTGAYLEPNKGGLILTRAEGSMTFRRIAD